MDYSLIKLINEIQDEFPDFKIIYKKDSIYMKLISYMLYVLTFGKQNTFMQSYLTTINTTVYVPSCWVSYSDITKESLLRHERIHMRQAKRYGFVIYSLLYLFVPLPMFFCYYRTKFEKEAYEETIKFVVQIKGKDFAQEGPFKESIINQFTSGKYGWMWPFKKSIEKWYDNIINKE